jgi:hypothetical protein
MNNDTIRHKDMDDPELSPSRPESGLLRAAQRGIRRRGFVDGGWFGAQSTGLTHYTSMKGLVGIIESGGFWLSDHRFLNDSEEYHNGRKLVLGILERLCNDADHQPFQDVLARTAFILEHEKEPPQYVCAFSTKPDNLDQWRAYAPGEQGVAITFDSILRDGRSHFVIPPVMTLRRIIYSDDVKTSILTQTIARYAGEFAADEQAGIPTETDAWAEGLSDSLAMEFITFKHSSYESEAETRMVVPSAQAGNFPGIRHRVTKNKIVSYFLSADLYTDEFRSAMGTDLLPVREIRVGPTATQQVTRRSIEEFLLHTGYRNVPVLESQIPFRG